MGGLINFFKNVWDAIVGFVEGIAGAILGLFATVADAVSGLGLMALASTIGALVNVMINAISDLMLNMAEGTVGLFRLDIGTGQSVFEYILTDISWIIDTMQILGVMLLFFIFAGNLVKIMCTPGQTAETPGHLMAGCLFAGMLIYFGPSLVLFVQRIFNVIYSYILELGNFDNLEFGGFVTAVQDYVTDSEIFNASADGDMTKTQVNALASAFLILFVVLLVFWVFKDYILEIAQRYVVMGVLIVTTPAAMAFAASRSTRETFKRWIRMVMCQFILMLSNVIFLAVFFRAIADVELIFDQLPDGGGLTMVILYSLLVYGLLLVGKGFDRLLKSLGLSAAETGAGMMATMMGEMMDIGMVFSPGGSQGGESHGGIFRTLSSAVGGAFNLIFRRGRGSSGSSSGGRGADTGEKREPVEKLLSLDTRSGTYKPGSINRAVKSSKEGTVASGALLGVSVLSKMRGLSNRTKDSFDVNTCTVQNGCIRMSTVANEKGQRMTVDYVPVAMADSLGIPKNYGRRVSLGGEDYLAVPSGPARMVSQFMGNNPSFEKHLNETYAGTVKPIMVNGNERTGSYRVLTPMPVTTAAGGTAQAAGGSFAAPTSRVADGSGFAVTRTSTASGDGLAKPIVPTNGGDTLAAPTIHAEWGGETFVESTVPNSGVVDFGGQHVPDKQGVSAQASTSEAAQQTGSFTGAATQTRVSSGRGTTAMVGGPEANNPTYRYTYHEWVPAGNHEPDAGLNAHTVSHAGMDYYHYEIPLVRDANGELTGRCGNPYVPLNRSDKVEWTAEQFPTMSKERYVAESQQPDGVIVMKRDKEVKLIAPVIDFSVKLDEISNNAVVEPVYAANGTKYVAVSINEDDLGHIFPFERREAGEEAPLAQETHRDDDAFSKFVLDIAPDIIKTANRQRKRRKKR